MALPGVNRYSWGAQITLYYRVLNPARPYMSQPGCYRQGDVFIIPIKKAPEGARSPHGQVLAYGEVTGHSHRVAEPLDASLYTSGDKLWMDVLADTARVIHDEHGAIDVPKGLYEIRIQREYTPQRIVRVVD